MPLFLGLNKALIHGLSSFHPLTGMSAARHWIMKYSRHLRAAASLPHTILSLASTPVKLLCKPCWSLSHHAQNQYFSECRGSSSVSSFWKFWPFKIKYKPGFPTWNHFNSRQEPTVHFKIVISLLKSPDNSQRNGNLSLPKH